MFCVLFLSAGILYCMYVDFVCGVYCLVCVIIASCLPIIV